MREQPSTLSHRPQGTQGALYHTVRFIASYLREACWN